MKIKSIQTKAKDKNMLNVKFEIFKISNVF